MSQTVLSLFSWGTAKSLLLFFGPALLPRAINYYRSLRVQLAHRPPPRPLPSQANHALNVLFGAIVLFLTLSVPINPHAPAPNIFAQTGSRITTPTDVIFARLARYRPDHTLTEYDKLLRSKLTSTAARKVYLRFGPEALVSCQYCDLEDTTSYLLHYLPFNSAVPHLLHLFIIGLVTSASFAGADAARWRTWLTFAAILIAIADFSIMAAFDPLAAASAAVRAGQIPPSSLFHSMNLLRPLTLALFDVVSAALIYISATHRFFYRPPSQADQIEQLVTGAVAALNNVTSKLHGVSVARNAVVRDKTLKARDDWYWRTAVAMEGPGSSGAGAGSIWEDEEVVRAMSRAMNERRGAGRGLDMAQLGVNAGEYVDGITKGLEDASDQAT
ncbi:hypothetical protein BGW36DRAFT_378349 [Talaromyces proteolyticus]|uniref:Uncharacterized protein n=1 Tax=Talaromyces proteolyticus TaxID=1131652 RepID=A0AAD4KSA7_9EURO|nr:uncharacterized protein BGW36DRAFT_378349 [Talaromyces proteolyticus]KAH8697272.1 hypothetical protein BGW36DRAFT_378349 [Talaromyces proteolyticus]